LVQTPKKI